MSTVDHHKPCLVLDHLSLPLLFTADFKVFTPFNGQLFPELALRTFHPQDNLFGRLGLLPKDGLRLATITTLFAVITTSSLCKLGLLSLLVLGHLVGRVLLTLALTEGLPDLWYIDHD